MHRRGVPLATGQALAALLAVLARPVAAAFPSWSLEIDRLQVGETVITGVRANSGSGHGGDAVQVSAASLATAPGKANYGPLTMVCPGDAPRISQSLCRDGSWRFEYAPGWPALEGTLSGVELTADGVVVTTRGKLDALGWSAELDTSSQPGRLSLQVPSQPLANARFLQSAVPQIAWVTAGTLAAAASITLAPGQAPDIRGNLRISGLDFDSPDGIYAGLGVAWTLNAALARESADTVALEGRLEGGELLLQDFYRDFTGGPVDMTARMELGSERVDVRRLTLADGESLHVAGEVRVPLGPQAAPPEFLLRELRLTFPEAYTRYLEPLASVWTLDGLDTRGSLAWTGDWSPGTARSGELRLENLGIVDSQRGRFAIQGLDGSLATGTESRLTWEAASFERLDLGAGSTAIALAQESVSLLEPLRIAVFGGALSVERFAVGFPRGQEPDIELQAVIENVEMQQMSSALGWPEFSGTLDGRIPGVNYAGGVVEVEGALEFSVFNGQILLTDLRVERPFGVLPSLAANITATALDLEQLTQTFEFGRIAGRLDGYVRDLRMLDWQPVQFDAWFGTPDGAGRNDISRQAVRHLATIGGGSPTALLTGPVLRLFNNFSYRRLGLGCRLQDNICQIRGIEEQGDGVLLLEGAGIPKISILAYNRAVDWPQLVAELTAVSGGEEVRIGNPEAGNQP